MSLFVAGSDSVYRALYDAGIVKEEPNTVRRVIIDLEAGSAAKIYVEKYADDRLIDVLCSAKLDLVA